MDNMIDASVTPKKLEARIVGTPYTDEDIANASKSVQGKSRWMR